MTAVSPHITLSHRWGTNEWIDVDKETKTGQWVLLFLPLITVMREGMPKKPLLLLSISISTNFPLGLEAVVFVGGVSLGQPATAIPIATVVGIVCGLVCGFLIYEFASRTGKFLTPNTFSFKPNSTTTILTQHSLSSSS